MSKRDSEKGTRTTLVDLGSDIMIKYKNLYIKDIKVEQGERERAKVCNRVHCIKTDLLKSIIEASIYRETMSDTQVTQQTKER